MLRAFWLGWKDGRESPHDLTSGLTWDSGVFHKAKNHLYDMGVNAGQKYATRKLK